MPNFAGGKRRTTYLFLDNFLNDFFGDESLVDELKKAEENVFSGELTSFHAAEVVYELFKNKKWNKNLK